MYQENPENPENAATGWAIVLTVSVLSISGCTGSSPPGNSEERGQKQQLSSAGFTNEQVKEIVDRQRAERTDLPDPFPEYRWSARNDGAYYVYIELALPAKPEHNQIFKINQAGIIVDVQSGIGLGTHMKCPDPVFTESELAEIVAKERARRDDLPPPFSELRTRVSRLRCLYLYFEYRLPEKPGDFHVFTIDPQGGLMDFFKSEP